MATDIHSTQIMLKMYLKYKEARARVVVRQMREYGFVKKEQFGVYRFVKE